MPSASAPGGEARLALGAGLSAYIIWGIIPLVIQYVGRLGVAPTEILAHRTMWAVAPALLFVLLAKQGGQTLAVLRNPRILAALALSAALIGVNWAIFIWAVNVGRVLETSLGYYINPLLNMAAGALIFREKLDRIGWAALGLATVGVVVQAVALGHLPFVSLALGFSFCAYGVVRKRVAADAQTGLLVECLFLAVPSVFYVLWLERNGMGHGFSSPKTLLWLMFCGPMTAVPLMLFAWAARRAPLSAMGFLLFTTPSITFVIGVMQGEPLTPLRALSFGLIWGGVGIFVIGLWRKARLAARAIADVAAS